MNIEQFESKIISLFEGDLTKLESDLLLKEIAEDQLLTNIFTEYQSIYEELDNPVQLDIPSEEMRSFVDKLVLSDGEDISNKVVPIRKWRSLIGVAASLILMVFVYNAVSHQNGDSNGTHIASAERSSTERIKAIRVGMKNSSEEIDINVATVLLDVLNNDPSSNVRLAAVETLREYTDNAFVRAGLITAIPQEQDGFVKIAILNAISLQDTEEVKQTLSDLANDQTQQPYIIDEAQMQLLRLDSQEF